VLERDELLRFLSQQSHLASAAVVRVEVERALLRYGAPAEVVAAARRRLEHFELRALTDELLTRAGTLLPPELRTIDAIHLAAALELSPSLDAFVCYDRRLAGAAASHGLPVIAPGTNPSDEVHEPRAGAVTRSRA
jgi:predicted nucleic acid-binding protein